MKNEYKKTIDLLNGAVPNPEAQALWIFEKRTGLNRTDIHADNFDLSEDQVEQISKDVKAIQNGTPISRVFGNAEFWGLEFDLNDATLDPRPDTELIVERAISLFAKNEPLRILDLGTGSGCILIALLTEFPKATGIGLDVSGEAINQARMNAQNHDVGARSKWIESDWFNDFPASDSHQFDLIVSNPPYITSESIGNLDENVRKYDPILALDGGKDGLRAYEIIFSNIFSYLKQGGIGLFEIGFDQANDMMRLSKESWIRTPLEVVDILSDYAGNSRVVEIAHEKTSGDK